MQKLCESQAGNTTKITLPKYLTVKLLNIKDNRNLKQQDYWGMVIRLSPAFSSGKKKLKPVEDELTSLKWKKKKKS